jgi:hypothetical protein
MRKFVTFFAERLGRDTESSYCQTHNFDHAIIHSAENENSLKHSPNSTAVMLQ